MEKHYPIYPLLQGKNRKEKRAMIQEYDRNILKIGKVEEAFAKMVFNPAWNIQTYELYSLSYSDMYKLYLSLYLKTCDKLHPKFTSINTNYFKEMYSPLADTVSVPPIAHQVFEFIRTKLWWLKIE